MPAPQQANIFILWTVPLFRLNWTAVRPEREVKRHTSTHRRTFSQRGENPSKEKGMKTRLFGLIAGLLMLTGILIPSTTSAHTNYIWHIPGTHPIIFVHGGSGSGAQFESQAMRFGENFYPKEYIYALDYDSTLTVETQAAIFARLDALIADIKDKTGADQVDLMGHSFGGLQCYQYIDSSPERAANVAHYISIDSSSTNNIHPDHAPGGVPSLALWADHGTCPGCTLPGFTNVTLADHTHVQMASSPVSFVEMYKFFTGFRPLTTNILPQLLGPIELAGRAVLFPQNVGVAGASLEIWKVNRSTGARIGSSPAAVYAIDATGNWGPFRAKMGQAYEFDIVRAGQPDHSSFYEPFVRSDRFIRLLTSGADGGVSKYMDRSPNHVNLLIGRNMEFWGDQGDQNDILEVNGTNVISATTHPITKLVNYQFVFDKGADGVSHLGVPIQPYASIGFFMGIDFFVPGASPANGTTSVALTSRLGGGKTQTINVPNIASSQVRVITVMFNDWVLPWP
jgi:hypothetical protein